MLGKLSFPCNIVGRWEVINFLINFEILQSFAIDACINPPQVKVSFVKVFFFADTPSHNFFGHLVDQRVFRSTRVDHDALLGDLRRTIAQGSILDWLFLNFFLFLFFLTFRSRGFRLCLFLSL